MPSGPHLVIKHMVCRRCIQTVERAARELGLVPTAVDLGELQLEEPLRADQLTALQQRLETEGFEIAESETARLINKTKSLIIQRIHHDPANASLKLSAFLAKETGTDFDRLSRLFSATESITIERYAMLQRIERVKELLAYGDQTVAQIADETGFSSAAHLSANFKQVSGMTPTQFRNLGARGRRPLDEV
jgi:AraC-like DNA-binding protein